MIFIPGFTLVIGELAKFIQSPRSLARTIKISSDAFTNNGEIPPAYTCKGQNISPGLTWNNIPKGTVSLILIMDDPDVNGETISHWVVYNIPSNKRSLPPSLPPLHTLPDETLQGVNDFRKMGYSGPCPKAGERHHYHFHLYAIDMMLYPTLPLPTVVDRVSLLRVIEGHVLGYGELTGNFQG